MTCAGVIEGFFGRPWSDAARRAYPKFLRDNGFSFYVYSPKADRYLRRGWREPFPDEELERLRTLSSRFRESNVRFGMGLTPYEIHLNYDNDAKTCLRRKVAQLDRIDIDILCIQFDDMRGGVAGLAALQGEVVADVTSWSSATQFVVCPTYYSDDPLLAQVFGLAPRNYLQDLGKLLDPAVDVFWTGQRVCSTGYPDAHVEEVASRLDRKPFIWDNHIANDGRARCTHLYLDPHFDGWILNSRLVAGLAMNPMNQPHLSRVPLAAYASSLASTDLWQRTTNFESHVRVICGDALGNEVIRDLELFQSHGLSEIAAVTRSALIDKYRRFEPDSCALEIGEWLRGEYDFDPSCLTE